MSMRIGPHLSIAKGFPEAGRAALSIGADTFQFFSRNPRGGSRRDVTAAEVEQWFELKRQHSLGPIVMHIPYTVNLAAPAPATWEFAVQVIREDIVRAAEVGAPFAVTHPGSHTAKSTPEQGLDRIVAALERCRDVFEALHGRANGGSDAAAATSGPAAAASEAAAGDPDRCGPGDVPAAPVLLLETMSGQGSEIGWRPQQLGEIIDRLGRPQWLGVCVDTCHVFAAGYDIRRPGEVDRLAADLDAAVGLDRVRVVHVNDSQAPAGSRRDRHACIGAGEIGLDGLMNLILHPAFAGRPLILETPVEVMPDGWGEEIRILRQAAAAAGDR
ncbi:MAG: deoxyribonuclease IV [Bacillota bacterium]